MRWASVAAGRQTAGERTGSEAAARKGPAESVTEKGVPDWKMVIPLKPSGSKAPFTPFSFL